MCWHTSNVFLKIYEIKLLFWFHLYPNSKRLHFFSFQLTDLPDLPLIQILSYIELEDLLCYINRTCKRLYNIIKNTPSLWRILNFFSPIYVEEKDLKYIFRFSQQFRDFEFAYATYYGDIASLDYNFAVGLSRFTKLTELNLSQSALSTLCFLKFLPNLEYLNLTECQNLCDADFRIISTPPKLESIYLSFNFISVECLIQIVQNKPDLTVLEIYGIGLTEEDFKSIVEPCYRTLNHIYLNLAPHVNEDHFFVMVHTQYIDLTPRVYKLDFYSWDHTCIYSSPDTTVVILHDECEQNSFDFNNSLPFENVKWKPNFEKWS